MSVNSNADTIDYDDVKSSSYGDLSMHSGKVQIKKNNNKTCGLVVVLTIAVVIIGILAGVLIYKEIKGLGAGSAYSKLSSIDSEQCQNTKLILKRSNNEKDGILSTTTSYENSFRSDEEWMLHLSTSVENISKSCTPVRFFLVGRHGARTTAYKYKAKFDTLYEKLKESNADFLKNWIDKMAYSQMLTPKGVQEWKNIGYRFYKRYPQLLEEDSLLKIKTSSKYRTTQSANSFVLGLSEGADSIKPIKADLETDNRITRFWETCKIVDETSDSEELKEPSKAFLNGEVVHHAVKQMSLRLFGNETMLTPKDMTTTKRICAYELLTFGQSHWCKLLTIDDLKLVDYVIALEKWYRYGPALWSLYSQSCYLMDYILDNMDQAINNPKNNAFGHLVFGHAETLIPLMTVLELFGDLPLENATISNFENYKNSQFHMSQKLPMASNIALVLYKCDSEYSVLMFVKEIPTPIPVCSTRDELMCPFWKLKQRVKSPSSTCSPSYKSCPPKYSE